MKKLLTLVLSLSLVLTLTACKEDEKEGVTLNLWYTSSEENEMNAKLEADFLAANPHITLNKVLKEGDPGNEYGSGVALGNAPDVIGVSFAKLDSYINAGIVADISEEMNAWDEYADVPDIYKDIATRDEAVYGMVYEVYPMLFGYNKTHFETAGITTTPDTWDWDDLLANAEKLKTAGYTPYGLGTQWSEWFFQYYVWQAGGDLTQMGDNGEVDLTFTDTAVIQAAEFYGDLISNGYTQSDLTMGFGTLVDTFGAGTISMMPFASDWTAWATGVGGLTYDELGIGAFPAGPSGSRESAISGKYFVVNPSSDDAVKQAAVEYIKFYCSYAVIEEKILDQYDDGNGTVNPNVIPRNGVSLEDIVPGYFNEMWIAAMQSANTNGRPEFYGKGSIGSFVDLAVQQIFVNPTMTRAEIIAVFMNQEEEAQKALDAN